MFLTSCVEYFDPTIDPPEEQPIIIDALLTDELKNHEVTITRAKYIEDLGGNETIENAEVYMEDNDGTRFLFNHTKNGLYTSVDMFAGDQNLQYRLVVTIDSEQYLSEYESMPESATMTNLDTRFGFETTQREPGVFSDEPRMKFFVDIELLDEESDSYFRFDWEATYAVQTPDQGDSVCWQERELEYPSDLTIETCYATETPDGFLKIFSTEGVITGKNINELEVYGIHPNKRFQSRYSPEITMYSISREAYEFWDQILNQNENAGGIFDPPFGPINGNIYSVNETSERVVGIFEVASVNKIRSFFTRPAVPIEMRDYQRDCDLPTTDTAGNPILIPRPFFCCDCTQLANCTNVRPDFW